MASDPATSVFIDGEEYSLIAEPPESSALVVAERKELASILDLETLVDDLGKVGGFIRISYNATASAGPNRETHKLHIKIEKLGFEINDICSKSTVTIANFRSTTRTILEELKSVYEYLLEGYEDMAVDSMSCLSTLAKKMADAAWELHDDFTQQYKKVQDTLVATKDRKEEEELEKIALENKQKDLARKLKRQREIIEEIKEKERLAREQREMYERKEDDEISNIKVGLLESICDAVTSIAPLAVLGTAAVSRVAKAAIGTGKVSTGAAGGVPAGVAAAAVGGGIGEKLFGGKRKAAEKRAALYRENVKQKLEEEKAFWNQRQASTEQQDNFLSEIESCRDQQSDTEIAIKFLHQASKCLKELAVIMERAATFWMQLQQHCQNLAEDHIKDQIENVVKQPEKKRQAFWRSGPFKRKAVAYYAKWVALNGMCHYYLGKIKVTQADLRDYIRENPTREEARKALPDLIKTYRADLKQEQERIMQNSTLAEDKIKMLEGEVENDMDD